MSATVMTGDGADKIYINTNLPDPSWPYQIGASFHISGAAGQGVEWVRKHLGVEPNVIQMGASKMKFSRKDDD